jgi:hypothetical protein
LHRKNRAPYALFFAFSTLIPEALFVILDATRHATRQRMDSASKNGVFTHMIGIFLVFF